MKTTPHLLLIILLCSCQSAEVAWDATGTFEATEVTVSAEATGTITSLRIEDGHSVEYGTILGEIDSVQLHLKKLQLAASRSGSMSRRQDVAKQIAATEEQIRWQESEKNRFTKLLAQNAATQKQVDDIENQIAVLQKQVAAQRSTLENSNRSITDESSAIEIQIAQIEDQLRKCYIKSPINGTILVKLMEQGEFATSSKPLFTVANLNSIYIRAYVTASQLTTLKLGGKARVYSDFGQEEQREYNGTIEWIASKAEFTPKTIQTRDERANMVYAIKIAVENDGYLKIGMYGQVIFDK